MKSRDTQLLLSILLYLLQSLDSKKGASGILVSVKVSLKEQKIMTSCNIVINNISQITLILHIILTFRLNIYFKSLYDIKPHYDNAKLTKNILVRQRG